MYFNFNALLDSFNVCATWRKLKRKAWENGHNFFFYRLHQLVLSVDYHQFWTKTWKKKFFFWTSLEKEIDFILLFAEVGKKHILAIAIIVPICCIFTQLMLLVVFCIVVCSAIKHTLLHCSEIIVYFKL